MIWNMISGTDMHRVTIYWKVDSYRTHNLLWAAGLPFSVTLNGEQYLDVTEEQLTDLRRYEASGWLEFRHKRLIDTPHGLRPDMAGLCLTNNNITTTLYQLSEYGKKKKSRR